MISNSPHCGLNLVRPIAMTLVMTDQRSIGIFDSGVGGLTVFRELARHLPEESFVYLGDTARVPYGTKSDSVVRRYALEDSLFLLDHDVKLIVVACNTATAHALDYLKDRLKVPVVGVIEPGVMAAIHVTKNKRVGVIATEGTIRSGLYEKTINELDHSVHCLGAAAGMFVPLIEEGIADTAVHDVIINHYLKNLKSADIDTLILGCTHYPFLREHLTRYFEGKVTLVDSAVETAHRVRTLLSELRIAHGHGGGTRTQKIFFTDLSDRTKRIGRLFLGNDQTPMLATTLIS